MRIEDYLNKEEIAQLVQKSNWKAFLMLLSIWGGIITIFVVVALFPNPFVFVIGVILMGGRQLGCAILMHDASHRSLFKSYQVDSFVGSWLGGYPIINDCIRYRPYHLKHHVNTGSHKDPDLSLTYGYPTTVISFLRKVFRDLAGISGLKTQIAVFYMNTGQIKYTASKTIEKIDQTGRTLFKRLKTATYYYWKPLFVNFLIWFTLWLCGEGWLFSLWVISFFTSFNLVLRVRNIAEHCVVPNQEDPHQNTRTTYANWLEKLLLAPQNVNYHAEHHLLMTVPPYNLPKMHRLLKERGFYEKGVLSKSYTEVLKLAVSK